MGKKWTGNYIWEVLNGVGVDGWGRRNFPFFLVFLRFSLSKTLTFLEHKGKT